MPTTSDQLPPDVNPLTQDHCDILCEIMHSCGKTAQLAEACEKCQLDVAAVKDKNASQAHIAQLIKQTFFPDRP
jgi:hypothetical protein